MSASSTYEPTRVVFEIYGEDAIKLLTEWMVEQDKKAHAMQLEDKRATTRIIAERTGRPYYGWGGGGYTYHFTPTTIGLAVQVENIVTREELDLSDALSTQEDT